MKAIINAPGDRAAGIHPTTITVDGLPDADDMRHDWRGLLGECFGEILDEGVSVEFEDETEDSAEQERGMEYSELYKSEVRCRVGQFVMSILALVALSGWWGFLPPLSG